MDFLPDNNITQREAPYYEDASESAIAGADLRRPLDRYREDVALAISKCGGMVTGIMPGTYSGINQRYGFRINFILGNLPGRIDVAALPIRSETSIKKEKALKQALYLLWKELDAAAGAWAYKPGSVPLIPYLIGPGGATVTEELLRSGVLPHIQPVGYLAAQASR